MTDAELAIEWFEWAREGGDLQDVVARVYRNRKHTPEDLAVKLHIPVLIASALYRYVHEYMQRNPPIEGIAPQPCRPWVREPGVVYTSRPDLVEIEPDNGVEPTQLRDFNRECDTAAREKLREEMESAPFDTQPDVRA